MTTSPFGDALADLARTGDKGGLLVRVQQDGTAKAVLAVKAGEHFTFGAEFTYERASKKPAGWVGVEWTF